MKRILVVENGAGFGGALTSLGSFLNAVSPGKYEFHLLTSYPQENICPGGAVKVVEVLERHKLYGEKAPFETAIRPLFGKRAGNVAFLIDHLTTGWRYAAKIARYIREHKIDLVHANNGTLINDSAIRGARKASVPVVVHVRAPDYVSRVTSYLAEKTDHFLPVSNYVAKSVLALGVPKEKITVVPEGLDAEAFAASADGNRFKKSIGLPIDRPIIGMVGCLVAWKGHRVFIEACARVFKDIDAVAVIVGDTPDGDPVFRLELEALARNLGVKERIWFAGHRSDVADAMAACDVIVHASTEPEPFGRVILEGMALCKVVIATDAGGPAEIIEHGINGLLVNPGAPKAMAERITAVLGDAKFKCLLEDGGHGKVEECYSIDLHSDLILSGYDQVL